MAPPKMPPEKWQQVRARWETDEREGFQWLIPAMNLPVSAPAIRKRAVTEKWKKTPVKLTGKAAAAARQQALKPARGPMPKAAKPAEDAKPSTEASETSETSTDLAVLDEFASLGLCAKHELFVREYLTDFNAVRATIRAGYSEERAHVTSAELRSNPKIDRAIALLMRARVQKLGYEADELVKFHLAVIEFDPNEVCEQRVHACRHCWGVDHAMQHTPSTWQREREKFQKAWKKMSESEQLAVGEFPAVPPDGWYEAKRGPNDECPECHGVGVVVTVWKDTRKLSPIGKLLFAGVKEGKEGREVVMLQKHASLSTLSSHLGLNKVAEPQVNVAIVTETAQKFEAIMAQARERQRAVLVERGIVAADA